MPFRQNLLRFDCIWHLSGSIALTDAIPNETIINRLEQLLEKQYKPVTERGSDFVGFDNASWRMLFAPGWLALVIYNQGRFWVEDGLTGRSLYYSLSSLHGLIFCLLSAAVFFTVGLANVSLIDAWILASVVLGWVYGMNIILALARVPRLVRSAVDAI